MNITAWLTWIFFKKQLLLLFDVTFSAKTSQRVNSFVTPGLNEISSAFKLCKPLQDKTQIAHLQGWVRNAFTSMAMVNYPYPASFLGQLPAWPVSVSFYVFSSVEKKTRKGKHYGRVGWEERLTGGKFNQHGCYHGACDECQDFHSPENEQSKYWSNHEDSSGNSSFRANTSPKRVLLDMHVYKLHI